MVPLYMLDSDDAISALLKGVGKCKIFLHYSL